MQKEIAEKSLTSKLLKHKKIILAAILPLGFWVGIFGFWLHNSNQQQQANELTVSKTTQNKSDQKTIGQISFASSSIDSDNDGLPDWEESVYGTDSHKPDTDNDGYLDGEEVVSRHDPLKKGPDDIIKITAPNKDSKDTATGKLSKIIIEKYLQTIQSQDSQNLSPDELNEILSQSFASDPASSENLNDALKSELYYFIPPNLEEEMTTSKDNSNKNITKYWKTIDKKSYEIVTSAPPYDLFKTMTDSMKSKNYKKLDDIISYYKKSYEDVKIITVPSSLSSEHKNILTALYKHWKISEAIKNYEQDPLLALLGLNEFASLLQQMTR